MSKIIQASSRLLAEMYDESKGIFSYSSFLKGDNLVNNFSHPAVIRYTINVLTGIQKANSVENTGWDFDEVLDRFISFHFKEITNGAGPTFGPMRVSGPTEGDKGLLLYVLSEAEHELRDTQFKELEIIVNNHKRLLSLPLQDVCWMLIGLTKHAERKKDEHSARVAEKLFRALNKYFFKKDSFLPYHTLKKWRKPFVSFGAISYFLWVMYEYGKIFKDKYAETNFKESCMKVIRLQGEHGEWPWFINVDNLKILDWYQIYSVHQDSMAMLFLLPALDLGISGAERAIIKSYLWLFGDNQLNEDMIMDNPFFIYRSIRKREGYEIKRRYIRAMFLSMLNKNARKANSFSLEINRECRSYHLGWILYVWCCRRDFDEFTDLKVLRD